MALKSIVKVIHLLCVPGGGLKGIVSEVFLQNPAPEKRVKIASVTWHFQAMPY